MANVKFSRSEFEKSVKITKEMEEKISMFGTPLESLTDGEVEIDITPNRPDLLSLQGYLRAFEAFLGKKGRTGMRKYEVNKSDYKLKVEKSLPDEWPYAFACFVKGLKMNDEKIKEIIQLQEKLGTTLLRDRRKGGLGVYPLDKIKFPIVFRGMDADEIKFRPLEFSEVLTARQILAKHPTGRRYSHICEAWSKMPVFVDSNNIIMSMPPIINSHDVGKVDEETRDVFVEVTGNDKNIIQKALVIMATALADMGGAIYQVECKQQDGATSKQPLLKPEVMKLNTKNVNEVLGINLPDSRIRKLLERMGYNYDIRKKEVKAPAWRVDVLHEVDVIEDIAIAYGYENFKPMMPDKPNMIGEESGKSRFCRKIAEVLIGLGFLEVSSYYLLRESDLKKTRQRVLFEVDGSKTDYKYLRSNLITGALRVLSENTDTEYPQKIFEIGDVFVRDRKSRTETGIGEKTKLVISLAPGNFTGAKQAVEHLIRMFNLNSNYKVESGKKKGMIEGRVGNLIINNKKAGFIGEVHPAILKSLKIKTPVAIAELNLKMLYNSAGG